MDKRIIGLIVAVIVLIIVIWWFRRKKAIDSKCPETGSVLVPHEDDETKYYKCVDGSGTIQSCDDGMIFDKTTLKCITDPNSGDDI